MNSQTSLKNEEILTGEQVEKFKCDGFLVIENFVDAPSLEVYHHVYREICINQENPEGITDGNMKTDKRDSNKNKRIMLPASEYPLLFDMPAHRLSKEMARELMGEEMALEYDMFINKGPQSGIPTPWHQDSAYCPPIPDMRALTFWLALDDATIENGCLWMAPGSHKKGTMPHIKNSNGVLECEGSEIMGQAIELKAGSCVLFDGFTAHYSRGNKSKEHRRVLTTNYRPVDMMNYLGKVTVNHTGERSFQDELVMH